MLTSANTCSCCRLCWLLCLSPWVSNNTKMDLIWDLTSPVSASAMPKTSWTIWTCHRQDTDSGLLLGCAVTLVEYEPIHVRMPIENTHGLELYPFEMDHLPDYFREKCTTELKETPIARAEGLKELKELVKSHKLLRDIYFVDDFLVQYLRNRKYDVHKAFKHVITYVNYVNNYSYMFKRVDIDKYHIIPYELFFTPLPKRCQDGCTILYYEFGKWDPDLCPVEEVKPLAIALYSQAIRDPMTQINGFKIIFDFTGTTFKQLKHFTPQNLYLYYKGVLEGLPGRMKQIIMIYDSFLARTIHTIFVGLATDKVKQRIVIKKYSKELADVLPASCLPVHCGGTLKEYYMKDWWRKAAESMDKPTYSQHNFY